MIRAPFYPTASPRTPRRGLERSAGLISFSVLPEPRVPMDADAIRVLIESGLPGSRADVHGPDGVHFEAVVVCEAFAGKLPLARHRMVYATLGERMGGTIHALR